MTTLELQLDDDMKRFVERQCQQGGFSSPEAYVESLLTMEQVRSQSERIVVLLDAAVEEAPSPREADDEFWSDLKRQVLEKSSRPQPS